MIASKRSNGRWRPVVVGAALVMVAVYILLALSSGLDRIAGSGDQGTALAIRPFAAGHDRAAAKGRLIAGDAPGAFASAQQAVRRDPLDAEAVGLLGEAAHVSGQDALAARVFAVGTRLGWREPFTQSYAFGAAVMRGDARQAADHLDALLRQSPDLAGRNRLLGPFDATMVGRRELAARLALMPAWAGVYFADAGADHGDPLARQEVATLLARSHGVRDCSLIAPLIDGLMRNGHYEQALSARGDHCERPPRRSIGLPVDGDFRLADPAHPATVLDWHFSDDGAISIAFSASAGVPRAVIVGNASSTTLAFAEQPMMLPPGPVRLRWRARDASRAASSAIEVSLTCDAIGSSWLAKRRIASDGTGFEADTRIPADCQRQRLVLGIAGGASGIAVGQLRMVSGREVIDAARLDNHGPAG